MMKRFTELKGHEVLLNLMIQNDQNSEVLGICLEAFSQASDMDDVLRSYCIGEVNSSVPVRLLDSLWMGYHLTKQ